ncbi:nickel-dependent hydrogenase large subunit [Roseospira navarrensis]|uniref:Hydrogenase expression/formation protein HupK n=1 Tax=Roseospira navarrensis TaxID=140058 RepID=A0A7X2D3T2_9PROT|nr:nickel-dependent hydrogenase large subunit [Roseospira navarrensis]MQX35500.1 hypothetical protein [Roseospira navarrensis]
MSHCPPVRTDPTPPLRARADGTLGLCLEVEGGRVARVRVSPSVRTGVTAALIGRRAEAAVPAVRRLFALCGRAHTVAALRAAEAARGRPAPPAVEAARDRLVTVEALDHAALALLLDGPVAMGVPPDVPALKAIRAALAAVADRAARPGWDAVGGDAADPAAGPSPDDFRAAIRAASARLRAALPGGAGPPSDPDHLRRRVAGDPAPLARTLALALADPWPGAVPDPPRLLTGWSLAALAEALAGPEADAFVLRPTWRGAPAETGPLARAAGHPLIAAVWAEAGPVAARLVARWRDLAATLDRLDKAPCHEDGSAALAATDSRGAGVAAVETARGLLVHRLVERCGRIVDWRVLAPTEWTVHPDGALSAALTGGDATDRVALDRRARRLVAAMDPCVACDIRIEETARA